MVGDITDSEMIVLDPVERLHPLVKVYLLSL